MMKYLLLVFIAGSINAMDSGWSSLSHSQENKNEPATLPSIVRKNNPKLPVIKDSPEMERLKAIEQEVRLFLNSTDISHLKTQEKAKKYLKKYVDTHLTNSNDFPILNNYWKTYENEQSAFQSIIQGSIAWFVQTKFKS